MENIVEHIYKSCDEKNTNSLPVLQLIEFIKPYMPHNLNELVELQSKLDPKSSNPNVDFTFFQKVMSRWIATLQSDDINNSFSDFPANFNQSFSPDASHLSCDLQSNNNNTMMNEQLEKLKHQLNKATAELDLIKQQLAACEDQNESLIAELNSRRALENKGRHVDERYAENSHNNVDLDEEVDLTSRKCEQLERMLSGCEKQELKLLTQINQLENENVQMKNKLETFQKAKRDSRKSLSELHEDLDVKESEITTLMEIIDGLKSELEEKSDVLNFYTNENKLLKQRTNELETLLKTNVCRKTPVQGELSYRNSQKNVFNTPKLLYQLSNPITPTMQSPQLKEFRASTPMKCSFDDSGSSSSLLSNFGVGNSSTLRSPHKTLKEELAEMSKTKSNDSEVESLHKLLREQEEIKNSLWQNMKELNTDNEMLLDYKEECLDLLSKIEEKDQALDVLKAEVDTLRNDRDKDWIENLENQRAKNQTVDRLIEDLNNLENNLKRQKIIDSKFNMKFSRLNDTLEKIFLEKGELIEKNIDFVNQSTQTDVKATVNVNDPADSRKSNYAKLQMKLDRLTEKLEKTEKELSNERAINVKLSVKYQEKSSENEKCLQESQLCAEKILDQTQLIQQLTFENQTFAKNQEIYRSENSKLFFEVDRLKRTLSTLIFEKQSLEESFNEISNKYAVEEGVKNNMRAEIEFLLNKQYQLEARSREDFLVQCSLKKQLFNSKCVHNSCVKHLQDELEEKGVEIRTLKKQNEVGDVEFFILSCNEELTSAHEYIFECCKFDEDLISSPEAQTFNQPVADLENEMFLLNNKISITVSLLRNICDKYVNTREIIKTRSEILSNDEFLHEFANNSCEKIPINTDESSFFSCSSEICLSYEEVPDILSLECDSFLENLQFEDWNLRHLSLEQMEEKFATLALLLTVDYTTLKKRVVGEKDKFQQLSVKFFSQLNYSLESLNVVPGNHRIYRSVKTCVQSLKETSEELLRSAVRCGIINSENKTAQCWNLIINYVAILSQENKRQMKEIQNYKKEAELEKSLVTSSVTNAKPKTVNNVARVTNSRSNFRFWMSSFLFVLFGFVVTLIFYVEHLCPKTGNRICPLQWIFNLFIEKTHSYNYQL